MAESQGNPNDSSAGKDLLMADYAYLKDSFWKNEEAGERRVQFYATLVTAVITALVAITGTGGIKDSDLKLLLSLYALFSLLVLGVVTLFRIIQRNKVSDGYKKDMDRIRQRVKTFYDEQKILTGHVPLRRTTEKLFSLRKFGGLSYTVAAINSVLLAALYGVAVQVQRKAAIPVGDMIPSMLKSFAATFVAQILLIIAADWRSKASLYRPETTHAGGVVVRFDSWGKPLFLLVKSKNNAHWVLPKGHIKKRENPAQAAIREIEEEAGITATVIDSIGTARYQLLQKVTEDISVHFFLMGFSGQSNQPSEKREQAWLAYEEALQRLEFDTAKEILGKANTMVAVYLRM